jgi:hypothetical protein
MDFSLGGSPYDLSQVSIVYAAGGLAAIDGPDSLRIYYSTDGGLTYSASPAVIFAGFMNVGGDSTVFADTVTIPLSGLGVTHVRMHFFNGQWPRDTSLSEWVFLEEITFEGTATPEPGTLLLIGSGLAGLRFLHRRRKAN